MPTKLSAISLRFGNVPQSTASASKDITLTNSGAVALTITSITTGNPDFTESDTCDGSVPAKYNCVITVTFPPSIIGAETGTLTVTDAAANSPQTASLTGTGIVQTKVAPASLTFATQKVGTTSAAKTVTLTNKLSTPYRSARSRSRARTPAISLTWQPHAAEVWRQSPRARSPSPSRRGRQALGRRR